jgi:hypothetical protein
VPGDDAAPLELREPRLHRPARDAQPAGDLEQPDARVGPQLSDQAGVERVDGHIDQSDSSGSAVSWSFCPLRLVTLVVGSPE